jgi:hypothetical protein
MKESCYPGLTGDLPYRIGRMRVSSTNTGVNPQFAHVRLSCLQAGIILLGSRFDLCQVHARLFFA